MVESRDPSRASGVSPSVEALDELKLHALAFTSCGVTIADAGRPDMPLVYVNEAFCAMSGYPRSEILGLNCRFLQREDREQPGLAPIRKALREGGHGRGILRNYRRDGTLFWNDLTVSPLAAAGRVTHYVGVQTDISQRQEAEQERERLIQELAAANHRLDDFAHVVSHDLRAPLRHIHRLCNMLGDRGPEALDDEGRHLLRLLYGRAHRLGAMVEGVLAYSRVRHSRLDLEPVDLGALVRDVIDLLDVPKGYRIDVADDLPVVLGNRLRLSQIFQNLVSNTFEHRGDQGRRATIGWEDGGTCWRLWVEDDGPGIPEEHRETIFRLFMTSLGEAESNAGVGLSIVRDSIERLGGRVTLDVGQERGARFVLELPKEPAALRPDAADP